MGFGGLQIIAPWDLHTYSNKQIHAQQEQYGIATDTTECILLI